MLIVNDTTIFDYLPHVIDARVFARLIGAHKADVFRAHILGEYQLTNAYACVWHTERYGGVYIDADTLSTGERVLPLYHLLAHNWHMVNADWSPLSTPIMIGVMGPWRANTSVAREWARAQRATLAAKAEQLMDANVTYPIYWGELNSGLEQFKQWFAARSYANGSRAPDGTRLFVIDGYPLVCLSSKS